MATRFYTSNVYAQYIPTTFKGAWDKTSDAVTRMMAITSFSSGFSTSTNQIKSVATANYDMCAYRGVSAPLATQTISGTLSLVAGLIESSASMDSVYHIHVYVTQGDSDTVRGTLLTDAVDSISNEFSTSTTAGAKAWSGLTLSSVTVSAGDRLVIEIGANTIAAVTGNTQLRYGSFSTTTDMVAGSDISSATVGWVEFSQTLIFTPTTRFYLNNSASQYTPATYKGAWDITSSAITRLLHIDKSSGGSIGNVTVTKSVAVADYDMLTYRGVSPPLAAQTIAGKLSGVLGPWESIASMDAVYHIHLYVTQGDSDSVRGTLLSDYVETLANELSSGVTGIPMIPAALSLVAVTAGDRLVLEIGARSITSASGGSISHYYGGTTATPDSGGTGDAPNNTAQWTEFDSVIALLPVDARISQVVLDGALAQTQLTDALLSQVVLDGALAQTQLTAAQLSQLVMEAAVAQAQVADAQLSQFVLDIAVQNYDPTPLVTSRSQVIIVG
jgi:predicted DNA-binding protein with PD1-like motif